MSVRDTFTKAADGSLKHDWEGQIDGKWTALGQRDLQEGRGGAHELRLRAGRLSASR